MILSMFTALLGAVSCTSAFAIDPTGSHLQPRQDDKYPAHTIDQPIDHFPDSARYLPHTNATFKQRYFFDSSYYKPGGPVFLYIGGETSGPSRFSNLETGIIQILMQEFNGLGVILENRYYGESYPFDESTTDNLAYLTTEQTIADNAYFATHAVFPGVDADLTAPGTPWILYGGSLAGAQTAFSVKQYSDILFGGIASSGVIHAVHGYPEWYAPIQKYAPQDCVASINHIIDKFDTLVLEGQRDAINTFKSLFSLESLTDDRDFAMTIAFPLGGPMNYPTNTWQELGWNSSFGSDDFWNFCNNVTNLYAPEEITKVDYVLANYTNGEPWRNLGNYANYVKEVVLGYCPSGDYGNSECFNTQNGKKPLPLAALLTSSRNTHFQIEIYWADTTNTATRSYLYSTCTEQGAYQVAPVFGPSLISRVLQLDYTQQWCTWAFPKGQYNSVPPTGPNLWWYNHFGDLDFSADRLAFIDGDQDVWLDLCYHSNETPPRLSSDLHPELLISGAGHHWDSYGILDVDAEPQFIRNAHLWEIRTVQKWLRTFKDWKS